jgi:hypothetical protein
MLLRRASCARNALLKSSVKHTKTNRIVLQTSKSIHQQRQYQQAETDVFTQSKQETTFEEEEQEELIEQQEDKESLKNFVPQTALDTKVLFIMLHTHAIDINSIF